MSGLNSDFEKNLVAVLCRDRGTDLQLRTGV